MEYIKVCWETQADILFKLTPVLLVLYRHVCTMSPLDSLVTRQTRNRQVLALVSKLECYL